MIKRILIFAFMMLFIIMLLPLLKDNALAEKLNPLATKYVQDGPSELGGANLVTSVIVTYRGLDTLGEVAVLFLATAGIGFLLQNNKRKQKKRKSSEILQSGTVILLPLIILLGVYIFLHGHLTPGGGFQGGVVIAGGFLLVFLAFENSKVNKTLLYFIESLSGVFYVGIGVLGLVLAGGFLDNRFLPLGNFGSLASAGAIPIIYSLVGLKVGSELVGILANMRGDE
jgi:multicomponent Na+:H+ antiporter subunit B